MMRISIQGSYKLFEGIVVAENGTETTTDLDAGVGTMPFFD
jgi:hypothetical protein